MNFEQRLATGLDRAPLNRYDPLREERQDEDFKAILKEDGTNGDSAEVSHRRSVLSDIKHFPKRLASRLHTKSANTGNKNDRGRHGKRRVAPTLAPHPPTDAQGDRLVRELPDRTNLPPLRNFIEKPVETVRLVAHIQGGNNFAETLAKKDVAHGDSVQIVRAYDKLVATTTDTDEMSALRDLEKLMKERQDAFVRWTMDRHVRTLRRVEAHRVPWKEKNEFVRKDKSGKDRMQWTDYGRHVSHSSSHCPICNR